MSLGDMFGKFTTMFKKEEPKPQPFLGQTTPQPGFFSNFKNPFATGGKKPKQTKQKKIKTKTKKNRK